MPDPLARAVRCLFRYDRRRQHELASHLGLVPSALSNGLKRPGAMERHRAGIASFWGVDDAALRDLEALDGDALEEAAAKVAGATRPRDLPVPGGWLVPLARACIGGFGPGRWAYVVKRLPLRGELVAYAEEAGYHLGHYARDGEAQVVIGPGHTVRVITGKDAACLPVLLLGERPEDL
jgi:hypothetical protein